MSEIMERNIKVITNAGGMNPAALKAAVEEHARSVGGPVPKVAVVLGDDLTEVANAWTKAEQKEPLFAPFSLLGEAETMWGPKDRVLSCNAYLGAKPIAEALEAGAQIVITGRCVDSALVLGPLLHEFKWAHNDFDRLSAGSLAGHIIECGAQCTGGNFTDWKLAASKWHDMGFPIAECKADGSFVVTKPQGTGGVVSVGSVAEQMLYEIGDPRAYLLPDVTCDWSHVRIDQLPEENGCPRVLVSGARGSAPPETYKVGATRAEGYIVSGQLLISGFDAVDKAKAVAAAVLKKTRRMLTLFNLPDFLNTRVELLGAEDTYGHTQTQIKLGSFLLLFTRFP
jgi:hypothetical protein